MTNAQWIEVGALVRGQLRTELAKSGIQFKETKSLTKSVFILDCPPDEYRRWCRLVNRAFGRHP